MTNSNNNIKAKVRTDKPDSGWSKTKDNSPGENTYKGYYVTLVGTDGYEIQLDPRIYEKR